MGTWSLGGMPELEIELAVQTGRPESKLKTHILKPGLVASDKYKMRRKGKVTSGSWIHSDPS